MKLVLYYGIYSAFFRKYNIWIKLYVEKYNIWIIIYIFAAKEYLCWRRDKL